MRVIFIFESLHKLIKADKLLAKEGVKTRVIPVPTSYHSVCGMCLECAIEIDTQVGNLLNLEGIVFERHHLI